MEIEDVGYALGVLERVEKKAGIVIYLKMRARRRMYAPRSKGDAILSTLQDTWCF